MPSLVRASLVALPLLALSAVAACSDDSAPASPASSAAGSGGAAGASGAAGNAGASGSGASGSAGMPPEPTCDELTGAPTWERVNTGLSWTKPAGVGPLDAQVNGAAGLAYGNGVFVMLAASANIDKLTWATSSDGKVWTQREQKVESGFLNGTPLHFTGKKFVFFAAHTNLGTFAYSSADGMTWESHKVSDGNANVGSWATGTNGVTVAGGGSGSLWSSSDLVTWTNRAEGITSYLDLAAGNGRFIATSNGGGVVYGSDDGATWAPLTIDGTPPGGFSNLEFGAGLFVLSSGGQYLTSADGKTFAATARTGNSDLGTKSNAASTFAGNRFVIANIDYFTGKSTFAASTDAKEWVDFGSEETPIEKGPAAPIALAYGHCRYVALNGTSPDGNITRGIVVNAAAASPAK